MFHLAFKGQDNKTHQPCRSGWAALSIDRSGSAGNAVMHTFEQVLLRSLKNPLKNPNLLLLSAPEKMSPLIIIPFFFSFPIACMAQQITHISQVLSITNLPCLSQKLVQAYTQLRYANCPQKTPQVYASCLCLQPTNVASVQSSMSFWGSLNCADRSSVDSSMAMGIFTLYCNLAMKEEAVTVTTDPGISAPLPTGVASSELPLRLLGNWSFALV